MFSRLERADSFVKDYLRLSLQIQERVEKTIELLVRNLQHPSLRAKKVQGTKSIWEVRVTQHYRLSLSRFALAASCGCVASEHMIF